MVKFVKKQDSKLMRFLGLFGGVQFDNDYWTTIGQTIYYPNSVVIQDDEDRQTYRLIIEHEMVHVRQYHKFGVPLFLFLYLFIPLPVFFSYFRWRFEREAYLIQLRAGANINDIIDVLCKGYFRPWPRSWMKKWFEENV